MVAGGSGMALVATAGADAEAEVVGEVAAAASVSQGMAVGVVGFFEEEGKQAAAELPSSSLEGEVAWWLSEVVDLQ